ncbi:MAG: class I adenylate-forming enzyme family protein [Mycobacteriales bacterium]
MATAPLTLADFPPAAVVDDAVRRSSDEVRDRALHLAAGLLARGVRPGDVVAWAYPPGAAGAELFHACWAIGAVAMPVHHLLSAAEVAHLVERAGPRFVVHPEDDLRGARPAVPEAVDPDATAVLLATSGSSGRPKLVRHTHRALAYKAALMVGVHGLAVRDVVLMPAPQAHVSGLLNGVLLPGAAGMTTVYQRRWAAGEALRLVGEAGVSLLIGPPTYFVQLLAEPGFGAGRVASLRLVSCGGAGVGEEFARAAAEAFGAVVKRTYGSTEAPTVTTAHAGDPVERGWCTDGRPVGAVELSVDPETGELSVRGPELFAGYDDPAATAAVCSLDGWFRTGDRAALSPDGWLTVTGRLSDVVIRGGENVAPAEVEAICASLPGVRQVVVVGYPDREMGERVGLVVVGQLPTLGEVRSHCARLGLARFKTPERIVRVAELPVRSLGKPDRAALRRLFG